MFEGERYEDEMYAVTTVKADVGTITVTLKAEKENNYYFTGETLFENVTAYFYDPNAFTYGKGSLTLKAYTGTDAEVNVPYGTQKVEGNAFSGTGVVRIVLPDTVTSLEKKAFDGAGSLRELVVTGLGCMPNTFKTLFGNEPANLHLTVTGVCEEIPMDFFTGCAFLESVEWRKPIRSIGKSAFYGCTSLTTFTYDDSLLESVGENAFSKCTSLTALTLPSLLGEEGSDDKTLVYYFGSELGRCSLETLVLNGTASYVLPSYAFRGMTTLKQIEFSSALTGIGAGAFSGIDADIDLSGTGVTTIKGNTFVGYVGESVILPENLAFLESYALKGFTENDELVIPASVTVLGTYAFSGCYADIRFADGSALTTIGERVFEGYLGANVVLPSSVTSFGERAFKDAANLVSIDLRGVGTIGENCFENCMGLTEITVYSSTTDIKRNAFKGCSNLTTAIFEGATPPTAYVNAFDTGALLHAYVPKAAVPEYKTYFDACGKGDGADVVGR